MENQIGVYAAKMLINGGEPETLVKAFIRDGLPESEAREMVQAALTYKVEHFKKQGMTRMIWGGCAGILGLAITISSYAASSGGRYIVFAGLMAVGGVYALVGAIQLATGWKIS